MSDTRTAIYDKITGEIAARKTVDRAFIIGVTGIDCAGKSWFAEGLDGFLRERGTATQLVKIDDFHQPAAVRHAGETRDEDHYRRIREGREFDFERLVTEVLRPACEGTPFTARIQAVDWRSDVTGTRDLAITPRTVLIVEGVFLFLETVRPYLDYVVFLDVGEAECLRRARRRDPAAVYRKYAARYLPAALAHLAEYPPGRCADLTVDNTDWRSPRLG